MFVFVLIFYLSFCPLSYESGKEPSRHRAVILGALFVYLPPAHRSPLKRKPINMTGLCVGQSGIKELETIKEKSI